jgi:T4-like virus tail tube protein gp19
MAISDQKRAYTAGKYALELEGNPAGYLHSAEGGLAMADVVEEKLGPDQLIRKHIAGVKYSDIELACGAGMSRAFYDWIADTFDHRSSRKAGEIVTAGYDFKERSRLGFFHALISEVAFPQLDAASKDIAKLTVKLAPEYTREAPPGGGTVKGGETGKGDQKKWLPANFRLTIDGLDCTKVNKIESLVVKQVIVEQPFGEVRDYERAPAHLEVSDLVVTLAESSAKSFRDWHDDFVVKGQAGAANEKKGKLELLSQNLKDVLFELSFSGLGIFKLTPENVEAQSENIRRVKASMYCEEIKFASRIGAAALSATAPTREAAGNGLEPFGRQREEAIVEGDYPTRFSRLRPTA